MPTYSLFTFFRFDALSVTVIVLAGFIGIIVALFSRRYMAGDTRYAAFYGWLALLLLATMSMAAADHLVVFLSAWAVSNLALVKLMTHKRQWRAAANSGWLAAKNFLLGLFCLTTALFLLHLATGQTSTHAIMMMQAHTQPLTIAAVIFMIITAMTQSAIWPFHRWLISSTNAPTPVSAIMHAGLVNGGGILLAKFAPLYFSQPALLTCVFILGVMTAVIGSIWKLMQSDIKRMLACSTMAQMGFMFAQCGLGLFPAAIAHICWHGLFKANLFLHANSVRQEKYLQSSPQTTLVSFMLALMIGIYGSYIFAITSQQPWLANDTTLYVMLIVFITASQFTLHTLEKLTVKRLLMSALLITLTCSAYGYSILLIETLLSPLNLMQPQPLKIFHVAALTLIFAAWVALIFRTKYSGTERLFKVKSWLYVRALNASQPHPATITTHRHQYQYH